MGSKRKLLPHIAKVIEGRGYKTALDAFSGSGCVGYMFKEMGINTTMNDFLKFAYDMAHGAIENSRIRLTPSDLTLLLKPNPDRGTFIQDKFGDRYFSQEDNDFLDNLISNIRLLPHSYSRSLALAAAHRSCLKRRARGIFTYTGIRYSDGRNDLKMSMREHFIRAVEEWNTSVFDNGTVNHALNRDVFDLPTGYDLVYLDPPYLSPMSDNDYTRRYHFVEGLASYWEGLIIQEHTKTKKILSKKTPFSSKNTIHDAFGRLFEKFSASDILLSYSSTGIPSKEELSAMLKKRKKNVDVIEIDHQYSFGTHGHMIGNVNNKIQEYLFLAS
jgi:DNA adenine methylase